MSPSAERSLRLVASHASADRLAVARRWLAEVGAGNGVLIVGATRHAADDLVRAVGSELGASFGWQCTTPSHLAREIALPHLARRHCVPLTGVGAEALVARVVDEMRRAGELGVYAGVAGGPGLVRALAATLSEVRLAGLSPAEVRAGAGDFAAIAERYERELERARVADAADIFSAAAEVIGDTTSTHPWLDLPLLLLDVRPSSRCEGEMLGAIAARASEVLCTAAAGDPSTEQVLAPILGVAVEVADGTGASALGRMQTHLFGAQAVAGAADDSVRILSAPGEARECVEVARRLCRLAEQGCPFDRMAIALRSVEEYRNHLEEALGRARIPAYFSGGVVRPHVAGRAFVALLDCAAEGLSARRFVEYLSLGMVPDVGEAGAGDAASVAPREGEPLTESSGRLGTRWERLLMDAAVVGGLDRWRRRLDAVEGRIGARLAAAEHDDPGRSWLEDDLAAVDGLRAFALPLLEQMDGWSVQEVWGEWMDRLRWLATSALRYPDAVLELLAELAPMAPIGPVGLAEVRLVLARRLLSLYPPAPTTRYGRVFVAPIDELRGLVFDVVFVPGMAERLFPRKIAEDPILLDDCRRLVADRRLPTNAERLGDERLALRTAVAAASRQVILSYPRLDLAQGRPRVPSFYALEAMRAAEGTLPTFDELAARAERETDTRIGWPAPLDVAEAIDEAEYDLALLDGLRSRDDREKVGTARFLLNANPHLGRALRFRARRWLPGWTPADGLLRPSETARSVMAFHSLSARSYSATALQKLATCPYQFLLYAVHRLAPREVADFVDELDPLRRGSLVHDCQFDLFRRLRDENLLPVRPDNLGRAHDLLDECLDARAAALREELLPRIERVWQDSVQSIRADLREWLRRSSTDDSGYVPWRFELAFGLPERDGRDEGSVTEAVPLDCGIRLRGSIDLVERRDDGTLRATDHKTGKVRMPAGGVVDGGSTLQPVLYALALEKLYPGTPVAGGRLSYCTSAGSFDERTMDLDANARQAAAQVARVVGEALETPFLPAAPARGACEWCDYRVVCGPYEEQRTVRKTRRGIESLEFLRSIP